MKGLDDLGDCSSRDRLTREIDGHFKTLSGVTQISQALKRPPLRRDPLRSQVGHGLGVQALIHRFHTGQIILWTALHKGPHDVMLNVSRQQAQGAQEPRIRWNQNGRCAQELRQWPGVQRSGTAKGHQGKALRIVPLLH